MTLAGRRATTARVLARRATFVQDSGRGAPQILGDGRGFNYADGQGVQPMQRGTNVTGVHAGVDLETNGSEPGAGTVTTSTPALSRLAGVRAGWAPRGYNLHPRIAA